MKFFLLFVAIVGVVSADSDDDLTVAKQFLQCYHRASEEGVPSIPIPKHDPLVFDDYINSVTAEFVTLKLNITDNIVYNSLNYTFPVLNARNYHNPESTAFGYEIHWPVLNFTGNVKFQESIPIWEADFEGTYNIVIYDVFWRGIFNLTKPGQEAQGFNNTVNAFSLKSSASDISVKITGFGEFDDVYEEQFRTGLLYLINNISPAVAEFLRVERFNKFWIEEPEHLRDLLDWCGDN